MWYRSGDLAYRVKTVTCSLREDGRGRPPSRIHDQFPADIEVVLIADTRWSLQ